MVQYNFLFLSLLFLLPGLIIFALRADLRNVMGVMAFCALPFALTERFFYPTYWEPNFLFDLVKHIGFGLEDLLFVIGLSSFTSTVYAFGGRFRYILIRPTTHRAIMLRIGLILIITFGLIALVVLVKIPMIYGSLIIMTVVSTAAWVVRPDLLWPSLCGGGLAMAVYTILCLAFAVLIPEVFRLTWHTDQFLNVFIFGIPFEEWLYGFCCGMAATWFYPFVTHQRFVRIGH